MIMTATTTSSTNDNAAAAKSAIPAALQPYADQAKQFAKDRPFATATLAGVLGLALLNTLRGK
jgi:ElaB/YqjD/DUF883 family membrane-anchored ribosome-binding protein